MKLTAILMGALTALSGSAHGAQAYDSYDEFYAAQPGAIFDTPIEQGADSVYSHPGEQGIYTQLRSTLDGKTISIDVAANRMTVNGETYRFARATTFPGEHAIDIYPASTKVFLAPKTSNRPSLLCVEGGGSGSGEADRHKQIFLLLGPLAPNATWLHLPSLLSSCRAVVARKDGSVAFPKNSYLFDDAQESRIGLSVSYYAFEHHRFSSIPAPKQLRLRFTDPEIPFQFSVQDKD
jgi:hypothetical protein